MCIEKRAKTEKPPRRRYRKRTFVKSKCSFSSRRNPSCHDGYAGGLRKRVSVFRLRKDSSALSATPSRRFIICLFRGDGWGRASCFRFFCQSRVVLFSFGRGHHLRRNEHPPADRTVSGRNRPAPRTVSYRKGGGGGNCPRTGVHGMAVDVKRPSGLHVLLEFPFFS